MGACCGRAAPIAADAALEPTNPSLRKEASALDAHRLAAALHASSSSRWARAGVVRRVVHLARLTRVAADTAASGALDEHSKAEAEPSTPEPSAKVAAKRRSKLHRKTSWADIRWKQLGGSQLEEGLSSGAVALLRLDWLLRLAKQPGSVLSRRQELPADAFVSLAELKSATLQQDEGLRIIVLSYGWTTPAHPDPFGATLRRVAGVLSFYLKYGLHGIFWDFASLMQHSPLPGGPRRTAEEQQLFVAGLRASSLYYAHPETTVLRLTTWPEGYPESYALEGANVAAYLDRGWCFSESCWFAAQLATKVFHDPTHDQPLVSRLYVQVFTEQLGSSVELDYHGMGWDDEEAAQLARVIASGAVPRLRSLNLSFNRFGDKGGLALAKALAQGLPGLGTLEVKGMQLRACLDPLRKSFEGRLIY